MQKSVIRNTTFKKKLEKKTIKGKSYFIFLKTIVLPTYKDCELKTIFQESKKCLPKFPSGF